MMAISSESENSSETFWIGFTPHEPPEPRLVHSCRGRIQIGSWSEPFVCDTEYWSSSEYIRHWRDSIGRIVGRSQKSALLVSMGDPERMNFLRWWAMYRDGDTVVFQEQMFFLRSPHDRTFSAQSIETFVSERKTMSDDGDSVSEWSIPVEALAEFLGQEPTVEIC